MAAELSAAWLAAVAMLTASWPARMNALMNMSGTVVPQQSPEKRAQQRLPETPREQAIPLASHSLRPSTENLHLPGTARPLDLSSLLLVLSFRASPMSTMADIESKARPKAARISTGMPEPRISAMLSARFKACGRCRLCGAGVSYVTHLGAAR